MRKRQCFYVGLALIVMALTVAGLGFDPRLDDIYDEGTGNLHPQSLSVGTTNRNALIASMESGADAVVNIIGDSTSNESTEWAYLLFDAIGTSYPVYSIQCSLWNDTTQDFDPFETIQSGTSGLPNITFDGSGAASLVDSAVADFTDDIDIRVKILPDTWPLSEAGAFAAHYAGDPNRSFTFYATETGNLIYWYSPDGTYANGGTTSSTAVATVSTVSTSWVRVVHDLNNGSSGNDIKFYTSSDGETWSQVGATITDSVETGVATGAAAVNTTWEIGANYLTSRPFHGKIYEVEFRDGIDAWPPNNTQHITAWSYGSYAALGGGSSVRIFNGSVSGAGISYMDNATRRPLITADAFDPIMTLVSISHNEGTDYGETWLGTYGTLIGNIVSGSAISEIVLLTQNPQYSPRTSAQIEAQLQRRLNIMTYAKRNGIGCIDIFPTFEAASGQMNADGVHPNSTGSAAWAAAVKNWLMTATPR